MELKKVGGDVAPLSPLVPALDPHEALSRYIAEYAESLLPGLRVYVVRYGLCRPAEAQEMALEVLSELVVTALRIGDRFDPSRQPRAWLLRIGVNVIMKRRTVQARIYGHEQVSSDMGGDGDQASDGDFFDHVASTLTPDPGAQLAAGEQAQRLLSLVAEEDREIIILAALHGFKGPELARHFGITATNARARLYRAFRRLRQNLERANKEEAGNG